MDASVRLLNKPQGSVTREDVVGVILQLRNVGANPALNLTMRERQGLSSMFMAVYGRGQTERVIDATYVPREMVALALNAMAFGGSNPRMPRPILPTGPILPGTRGSRTAVPVPGNPTAETAQLLAAAQQPFRGQALTNAGRAATKHPEYFGFESTQALRAVYRTDQQINTLANQSVQQILASGTRTTGAGGRYPNGWITYTLPDGRAASWQLSGEFIGFRGVVK
jgi:hypothetical protein